MNALDDLASGMDDLDAEEIATINQDIPTIGARLGHLPFCKLRASKTHRFGALRAYLKAKSFESLVDWGGLKWRPLISFRKHRWRVLLSMVSRF